MAELYLVSSPGLIEESERIRAQIDCLDLAYLGFIYDREPAWVWAAVYKRTVVGFGCLERHSTTGTAFLSRCVVSTCFRGRGWQRAFIDIREELAREQGFEKLVSYTTSAWSLGNLMRRGYEIYTPSRKWGVDKATYVVKTL